MPKLLILVRHAKSDWSLSGQKDFDRTLNERGHRDAPRMGKVLFDKNISIDAFISSPAERARLTARYFVEQFKVEEDSIIMNENIYEASARVWMNEVNDLDNNLNTVVIFGHNPGISYFSEYMTKEELGEIPTCAIIGIAFEVDDWKLISENMGKLVFNEFPEKY
ncbi:MAG: SixA phosphatase family protein [Cytophagales bacterium]